MVNRCFPQTGRGQKSCEDTLHTFSRPQFATSSNPTALMLRGFVVTALAFVFMSLSPTAFAQVAAYSFTSDVGTPTDMTGGTSLIGPYADDNSSSVTAIGFNFVYAGTVYTQFSASSNGILGLGSNQVTPAFTNNLAGFNAPIIAALWEDWEVRLAGSAVSYKLDGIAPNRVLTVQWQLVNRYFNQTANLFTFQARLYESSNAIEFVYVTMPTGQTTNCSIGLCSSTSDRLSVTPGAPPTTTTGAPNNSVNLSADGTPIAANTMYRMAPNCALPPVLAGVPASATVECNSIPSPPTVTATDACEGSVSVNAFQVPSIPVVLSHHWSGDGNYSDAVGSATGTPIGAVSFGPGLLGSNSFAFDGTPGYINVGTAGSVSGTGDFAVGAWIRTTSTAPMVIIQQRDAGFNGEFILKVGGNHNNGDLRPGKLYWLVYGSGSPVVDQFSSINVNDGKWHHVLGERNGTNIRIYIDGVLAASASTVVSVSMAGSIGTYIGRDVRDNNSNFNGSIDDIRVWTASPCPSTYEIDRTWTSTDASGNTSAAIQHLRIEDTTPPGLTGVWPSDETEINLCKSAAPSGPTEAEALALFADNCGAVSVTKSGSVTGTDAAWSVTYLFDVVDDCGNHVTPTPSITYSGGDQSVPVPDVATLTTINGECSAAITTIPTATDVCAGTIQGTTSDPLSYTTQGTHIVTWTYDDGNGNTSTQTQTVIVDDVTAPVINANASINLWPPNHDYVSVSLNDMISSITDNCVSLTAADAKITSVWSDEPENANGSGDGNTLNDIVISSSCNAVQLRRERNGTGNGRVYTVNLAVSDGNGNVGTYAFKVTVPHNQNSTAVDDGASAGYTVNSNCTVSKPSASSAVMPGGYLLEQNYPNPFNPSTIITYAIPADAQVRLVVYDMSGNSIAVLADGPQSAGRHVVSFNASGLASGTYIYTLEANGTVITKTMKLTK